MSVVLSKDSFVHLADLHLAPRVSSLPKRDAVTNRLIRDIDMDDAFVRAIDEILRQDVLPACVVIAGDLFDTYKGSPDAFNTVLECFRRLVNKGIHIVGIAGNHDTPTNLLNTPMFSMLVNATRGMRPLDMDETGTNVYSDCDNNDGFVHLAYDSVAHVIIEDVEYVLLPHLVLFDGIPDGKDCLVPVDDTKRQVLVVHGVAAGDPALRQMDEAKEMPVAKWILDMNWDYVAFGHFHKPGWIPNYKGKAAYCGSLENTVISGPDVCMKRGPVFVDLSKSGTDKLDMHEQPIRQIVNLEEINANDYEQNPSKIDEAVESAIKNNPIKDAIVRLAVKDITRSAYKSLPHRSYSYCDESALSVNVNYEYLQQMVKADNQQNENNNDGDNDKEVSYRSQSLLSLGKEAELMLDRMVEDGSIVSDDREAVLNILNETLNV